jgi:hypothetical protein
MTLAMAMPLSVCATQQAAGSTAMSSNAAQQASGAADAGDGAPQQNQVQEHAVTPPKVTCRGNTISISAKYSRLGAILSDIQKCTAVQFDAPEDAKMSLIFDEIGPGTSADVVATLLNSSGYDFVIGASPDDPEKIEKVILLARNSDKNAGTTNTAAADGREASPLRRAFDQMRDTARPKSPEEQRARMEAAQAEAEADAAGAPAENAAAPSAAADATAAAPADTPPPSQADDGNSSASKPSSGVADKIADMQKLFEQRRQMIQQTQQQAQPQQPGQTPQPSQPQPKEQQPQ